MAPRKRKGQKKVIVVEEKEEDEESDDLLEELSQLSQCSQRSRSKNYSKEETDLLIKICASFQGILNKNSNRDADVLMKQKCWDLIKRKFDEQCRIQAIYVSLFT